MTLAPASPSNPRRTYGEASEGGALTPLAVGQATNAAPTVTVEPQVAFNPVRMVLSGVDAAGASINYRLTITEIKVGARTMFRAGGAATGVPASLYDPLYTGANPSRFDTIRPGTQFSITIAGLAAGETCDIALVGRAA